MEVWRSLELSWFGPGEAPAALTRWLAALDAPHTASGPRSDAYFLGAGPGLGIKFRDGSLEVKECEGVADTWRHGPWQAPAERWRKWRFAADEHTAPDDARWCAVRKSETGVRWWFDAQDRPAGDGAAQRVTLAVQHLTVAGSAYWRLACDIGAREPPSAALIARVAGRAFRTAPPLPDGAAARAYPAFLAGIAETA